MPANGSLGNARYERLATLASGGMAKVYLGRAQIAGAVHTVAIKVLHPHLAQEADMVAMFLDEARVSIKLHHPNVVHVWDIDLLGEELVIVMEYIEGATLSQLLRVMKQRGEQIPVGVVARILTDALAGLHAAHELVDENSNPLGLVHRDVSPQNLLVGADGITRVADFGVALSTGRLAQTQGEAVKGKLRYLAPEQVLRRPLDRRLDLFSAGIVLWEGLTNKHLFDGGTEAETLTKVMREAIPPPSTLRPEVSVALDEACLKALERDPARRFESAEKFAEALVAAVGEEMASPEEVGSLVMSAAHDAIQQHRVAIERAEGTPPSAEDRSTGGFETTSAAPRPLMRLAMVAVLCLLIGGTAVGVASRGSRAGDAKAAATPTPTVQTAAQAAATTTPFPSASASATSTSLPPTASAAAADTPSATPAKPPTAAKPARTPDRTVRKPLPSKPGDSFMPGGL